MIDNSFKAILERAYDLDKRLDWQAKDAIALQTALAQERRRTDEAIIELNEQRYKADVRQTDCQNIATMAHQHLEHLNHERNARRWSETQASYYKQLTNQWKQRATDRMNLAVKMLIEKDAALEVERWRADEATNERDAYKGALLSYQEGYRRDQVLLVCLCANLTRVEAQRIRLYMTLRGLLVEEAQWGDGTMVRECHACKALADAPAEPDHESNCPLYLEKNNE